MTLDLEPINERWQAAWREFGPWQFLDDNSWAGKGVLADGNGHPLAIFGEGEQAKADGVFAAHAIEDVRLMALEIMALRAERDELRAVVAEVEMHREMDSTGTCVCGNDWQCDVVLVGDPTWIDKASVMLSPEAFDDEWVAVVRAAIAFDNSRKVPALTQDSRKPVDPATGNPVTGGTAIPNPDTSGCRDRKPRDGKAAASISPSSSPDPSPQQRADDWAANDPQADREVT